MKNLTLSLSKLIATILIIGYFGYCVTNQDSWHIIDSVDLIFHEAGHAILSFCGEFIYILGGSLFQLLVPFIFVMYFFRRRDFFSSSLVVAWLGYNLVNLSKYIGDAVALQLDLLGGDAAIHDWNYLLSETGLLFHCHQIANVAYGMGVLFIIIAAILGLLFSFGFSFERKTVSL